MIGETGPEVIATDTVTLGDAELLVRAGTFDAEMTREIFEDRYYTCDGWDIPPDARVLDLGGGIGAFAVYAALAGAAEVHTYEPIPESFFFLLANVAPYPQIHPHRAAVATEPGVVRMSGFKPMPDGVINTGLPAISDAGLEVDAVSIHDVLTECERWDVVKIDIEGYEYELIEAMTDDELASVGIVTMEFHHHDETTTHQRGLNLAAHLEAKGFTVEVEWSWGLQGRLRARR